MRDPQTLRVLLLFGISLFLSLVSLFAIRRSDPTHAASIVFMMLGSIFVAGALTSCLAFCFMFLLAQD